MKNTAYIALGSNLGNRKQYLDNAIKELQQHDDINVVQVSRYWETEPQGGPVDQGKYLNAVAQIHTVLSPAKLMRTLLNIETKLGRERVEQNGPRTLDLDLLLYDDIQIHEKGLTVPHPRLHCRSFVLGPLIEIAPTLVHPLYKKTMVELLADLSTTPLVGKTAFVSGSSKGIGKAIALALAEKGADVAVHTRRSQEQAEEVVASITQQGRRCQLFMSDLQHISNCHQLVDRVWESFGPIDIWVNNAGVDILTGDSSKLPFEEKLRLLIDVDVQASMLLSREVGQFMKERGYGCIINMGWDQADIGMEGDSGQLFGSTKAAVMAFSKSLAVSLSPAVRVNCVAPGWIKTEWGANASKKWQERVIRETLLQRWGTPADVANSVCWLASPEADYITGQVIYVNGGAVR